MTETLLMGAVAYDPKVVTIWERLPPLARASRACRSTSSSTPTTSARSRTWSPAGSTRPGTRRWPGCAPSAWPRRTGRRCAPRSCATPTGPDLGRRGARRLRHRVGRRPRRAGRSAVGAVDSPQATLIPLAHLRRPGLRPATTSRPRSTSASGLHGDHIGGERDAARALVAGEVDAACMIDGNHLLFAQEGTLPAGSTRILAQTAGLRPLQHDRRRHRAGRGGRPVRRAAAGDVLRRPARCARCSTWRA